MKIESRLGLSPEELITTFNKMYMDVWEKNKEHVPWDEKDIASLLIPLLEVVVTAVRDSTMLTIYENNERIFDELAKAGVFKQSSKPNKSSSGEETTPV